MAHKRQRPGLHYLLLGKMRKEVKSTMWNLLTVRTVLYAPNDDIWYRNEGTQETQLYNLSRINMLSDSLPTWKNCTPNELIIKVLQWALFFVTGYLLSVQCSIPYARQSPPLEARLAEGNSLPHSPGGYKGDARGRLKWLRESKLVAATHLQHVLVPH